MLPEKVNKALDEIKTPSNRILVTILLIAVSTLSTIYYRTSQDRLNNCQDRLEGCEASGKNQGQLIERLRTAALDKSEADNMRLKQRLEWQDSVKHVLQNLNNQK